MTKTPTFDEPLTPTSDEHVAGERLHIRHRHSLPSKRGGLTLESHSDGVWMCVVRQGRRWQHLTLRKDEVRRVRDWLTAWLDSR